MAKAEVLQLAHKSVNYPYRPARLTNGVFFWENLTLNGDVPTVRPEISLSRSDTGRNIRYTIGMHLPRAFPNAVGIPESDSAAHVKTVITVPRTWEPEKAQLLLGLLASLVTGNNSISESIRALEAVYS